MAKKPVKVWIFLLIAPFILFFATAVAQAVARATLTSTASCTPVYSGSSNFTEDSSSSQQTDCKSSPTTLKVVINIFSLLAGVAAVLGIMASPLWIIFLVMAIQHNNKLTTGHHPTTSANPPPQE